MYKITTIFTILLLFSLALFSCSQPQQETPKQAIPQSPASFQVSNIKITPTEVSPHNNVTITVDVVNTGKTFGSYPIVLKINGNVETTQTAELEAGASKKVEFIVSNKPAGSYSVAIDSLSGKFTVVELPKVRSVTWTDEDFNMISRILTGVTQFDYETHFIDGNRMLVRSAMSFTFNLSVCDGKLCFTNVDYIAWLNIFIKAQQYFTYDNGLMTTVALPDKVLKMIGPDIDELPIIDSVTTDTGKITITYRSPKK